MQIFRRNQNRRLGFEIRISMREGGLLKFSILIALALSVGAWYGFEVRANVGQGLSVWQRIVGTLSLHQSGNSGGQSSNGEQEQKKI